MVKLEESINEHLLASLLLLFRLINSCLLARHFGEKFRLTCRFPFLGLWRDFKTGSGGLHSFVLFFLLLLLAGLGVSKGAFTARIKHFDEGVEGVVLGYGCLLRL